MFYRHLTTLVVVITVLLINSSADRVYAQTVGGPDQNLSVLASADSGNEAECSIAVSPLNPSLQVVASHTPNSNSQFASIQILSTVNGGQLWTRNTIQSDGGQSSTFRGDPSVAYGLEGTKAFVAYLKIDNFSEPTNTIQCAGFDPVSGSLTPRTVVDNGSHTYDRPRVAVGPEKFDDYVGNPNGSHNPDYTVLVAAANGGIPSQFYNGSGIELFVSHDAGQTWSDRLIAAYGQSGLIATAPSVAVAPTGPTFNDPGAEVYVVWLEIPFNPPDISEPIGTIRLSRHDNIHYCCNTASDFGLFEEEAIEVGTTRVVPSLTNMGSGGAYWIPAQPERGILANPTVAVDQSNLSAPNSHRGRVYVAYADGGQNLGSFFAGRTDVYVTYSDEKGIAGSWSERVRVHGAHMGSEFHPRNHSRQ